MEPRLASMIKSFRSKQTQRELNSISSQQAKTTRDYTAKGPSWVSRATFDSPDTLSIQKAVIEAFEGLKSDNKAECNTEPPAAVKGQWVAYRSNVKKHEAEPRISEKNKYKLLLKEVGNETVIFYVHGGAFYSGSPAQSRPVLTQLAQLSKGRCFGVQYRLSPQHAFPAAIEDILLAYLSLLYPSDNDFHAPVKASNVVFSGDSSGANLLCAMLQVIQYMRRKQETSAPILEFRGSEVELPMPAGVALYSVLGDNTHSLPSYSLNAKNDFLADPQPCLRSDFPKCEVWPTARPRGDIYCEISTLCHPLVSPVATHDWDAFPPLWFACGDEQMLDDSKVMARNAAKSGVAVLWNQYELMPHLFAFLFPAAAQAGHMFKAWAKFCQDCVLRPGDLRTGGTYYSANSLQPTRLSVTELTDLGAEEVQRRVRHRQAERRVWTGDKCPKSVL